MALNVATLKTRSLSAVFFVLIMCAGLFINEWTFFLLFSFIHFGCWFEYQKLVGLIDKEYALINGFHQYGVMIAGFGFMLWMLNDRFSFYSLKLHELGWWILVIAAIVLPISEILFSKKLNAKMIAHSFFGLLYISLSWGLMMKLAFIGEERTTLVEHTWRSYFVLIPIFTIGCMWVNDTMAYIVGSLIGKTPFSKISPKKTWEGTIGGIILCAVAMGFLISWWDKKAFDKGVFYWILVAAIAAIVGTAGDLLESKLKRLANVKDSGNIMPGHGGFLDRFDSLLLATPVIWLFLYFTL